MIANPSTKAKAVIVESLNLSSCKAMRFSDADNFIDVNDC